MKNLHILENEKCRAAADFCAALRKQFPTGTAVRCFLNHRQKRPSAATVGGAHSDGRILVRLSKPNRRGHQTIKRVHWLKVSKAS